MPSQVNITLANARLTGLNVSVPQRAVDVTINWVDDAGVPHTNTQTVNFPNVLANANLPAGWLQDKLIQLCLEAVRLTAGVDTP